MHSLRLFFFFLNDTPPTEIYTLSLHDALPISGIGLIGAFQHRFRGAFDERFGFRQAQAGFDFAHRLDHSDFLVGRDRFQRSEEHTSELQSRENLVCRLLLEKKKKITYTKKL